MIRSLIGFGGMALLVVACSSAAEDNGTQNAPLSNCAHSFQLKSPSGTVLDDVGIVNVYWGDSSGVASTQTKTWKAIGNDPRFYRPLQEYMPSGTTLRGRFLTSAELYPDVPPTLTEEQFESELAREITAGELPTRSGTMIPVYVVYLPADVQGPPLKDGKGGAVDYLAYHHYMRLSSGTQAGMQVAYAIVTHTFATQLDVAEGHEVWEAISNPFDDGWRDYYEDDAGLHNEIADVCNGLYDPLDDTQLQEVWSQQQCACVGVVPATTH